MDSIFARKTLIALAIAAISAVAIGHPGSGIAVDQRGRVYFVDTGAGVWMIDVDGRLAKRDGPLFHWMALDEVSRFGASSLPRTSSSEIVAIGSQPTLILASDFPIAIGRDGFLYYPELGSDRRLRMMRFSPTGEKSVHATLPGNLRWINGIAAGPDDSLYYTEDKTVRKIDRRGIVSAVATEVRVPGCTLVPGIEATMQPEMRGLAVASDGALFVAASGCGALIKITTRGEVTTVSRTESPWSPTAVTISANGIYVLEYLHTAEENRRVWVPRVRKIMPDGSSAIVAAVTR
jgi:glucose/arabinose dehydrogenase